MGIPEDPELMGHGGHGHAKGRTDVADAHLPLVQGEQYPDAGGIPEDLEEIGKLGGRAVLREAFHGFGDPLFMDPVALAAQVFVGHQIFLIFTNITRRTTMAAMTTTPETSESVSIRSGISTMAEDSTSSSAAKITAR